MRVTIEGFDIEQKKNIHNMKAFRFSFIFS